MDRRDVLTVPNVITVARLLLLAPLTAVLVLTPGYELAATIALVVFGSTDWVDGVIARRTGRVTRIGEILDPVADRLGVVLITIALAIAGVVPMWFLVVVVCADLFLVLIGVIRRAELGRARVSFWGKARTALTMTAMPLALFARAPEIASATLSWVAWWMLLVAAVMHVGAALHYAAVLTGVLEPPHRFLPAGPVRPAGPTETEGDEDAAAYERREFQP